MKRFILMIFVLLIATPAWSATYYVTQAGAGSRNGSLGNEWSMADLNSATLAAGDVVYFSGKLTSQLNIPTSGTALNPITFDGYAANNTVDVTGGASTAGFAYWDGTEAAMPIRIYQKIGIVIRDFRFTGWRHGAAIYTYNSSDITIANNHLHDGNPTTGDRGIWLSGVSPDDSTDRVIIEDNLFDGIDDNASTGNGVSARPSRDVVVRRNVFKRCLDGVAFMASQNVLIEYNSFLGKFPATRAEDHIDLKEGNTPWHPETRNANIVIRYNNFHDDEMWGPSGVHPQRTTSNTYIYANNFYGQAYGVFIYGGAASPSDPDGIWPFPTENIHIWSNVFDNGRQAVRSVNSSYGTVDDIYVYNNTIHNMFGVSLTSAQRRTATAIYALNGTHELINNLLLNNRNYDNELVHIYVPPAQRDNIVSDYNLGYNTTGTALVDWYDIDFAVDEVINFELHGADRDNPTNYRANPALDETLRPTIDSTNVIDKGVTISLGNLPNYLNRFTINGETYCNNVGGTCDNLLSYNVGLAPTTVWSTHPPTVNTALHSAYGAGVDLGAYVYGSGGGTGGTPPPPAIIYGSGAIINALAGATVNQLVGPVINRIVPTAEPAEPTPDPGDIVYVASETYTSTSSNSIVITKPAGTTTDDLMVAFIIQYGSLTPTAPTGWTQLYSRWFDPGGANHRHVCYYRVAGAAEGASYTWTLSNVREVIGSITTFRGADPTTPVGNYGVYEGTDSRTNAIAPTITTQDNNNWAIAVASSLYGTTWTAPENYTERIDTRTRDSSWGISLSVNTREYALAGATGTATVTAADADYHVAAHIELIAYVAP